MSKVCTPESANRVYQRLHNVPVCNNLTVLKCRVTMESQWERGACPRQQGTKVLQRRNQPRHVESVPMCFPPAPSSRVVVVVPTPPPPPPRRHTEAGASTWGQVFVFFRGQVFVRGMPRHIHSKPLAKLIALACYRHVTSTIKSSVQIL